MKAAPIRRSGPLPCPACRQTVACRWPEGRKVAQQQCGGCGHVWAARWPGFPVQPETVVVSYRQAGGHDAA